MTRGRQIAAGAVFLVAGLGLVLAVALQGCASSPTAGGGGRVMDVVALSPAPFGLYAMTKPAGSDPVPAAYDEAERRFAAAREAYENTRYLEAARGFLSAAAVLPRGPGPHASTLAADRSAAYRNAASSWVMAGAAGEARAALQPLQSADPECSSVIEAVLASLPKP